MSLEVVPDEAEKLARQILRCSIGEKEKELYHFSLGKKNLSLSKKEMEIWSLMLRNHLVFTMIESSIALYYQRSPIRHRILCMLAVLETQPSHANKFINKRFSFTRFFFHGLKAAFILPAGIIAGMFLKIYSADGRRV